MASLSWKQRAWLVKRKAVATWAKTIRFDLDDLFLTGKEVPYMSRYGGGADFAGAYSSSQAAYACIRRQATDISSAPMVFLTDPNDVKSAAPANHPLVKLFNAPGPGFTRSQVIHQFVTYVLLRGDAFLPTDTLGNPKTLYSHFDPHHWKALTVNRDGRDTLAGWEYRHDTDEMTRLDRDLIYHKLSNPYDPWRGQSPLQAASYSVAINRDGAKYHSSVVAGGGERGVIYKHPSTLTDPQYEQLKARLKSSRYKGEGRAPGDVILEGGMEIIPPSFTAADIEILALLGPSKEDICQVFGMSPTLIGQANESNYSTFRGYLQTYWLQTLVPFIKELQESFDRFTVPYFGLYTRWDLSKVDALQDYLDDRKQTATAFYKMGVTMHELNRRLNLGFDAAGIIAGDECLVNLSQAPMSQVAAGATVEALLARQQQSQTPEVPEKNLTAVMHRAASLDLALPHRRRLAKLATRTKGVVRRWLLDRKDQEELDENLQVPLIDCIREARQLGAAFALQAAGATNLDDALLVARAVEPTEQVLVDGLPSRYAIRLCDPIDGSPASYNSAINLVSPVVNELVQEAAHAGFDGRLQAMGYTTGEE